MLNIDENRMQRVIQEAFDKVSGSRRHPRRFVSSCNRLCD